MLDTAVGERGTHGQPSRATAHDDTADHRSACLVGHAHVSLRVAGYPITLMA